MTADRQPDSTTPEPPTPEAAIPPVAPKGAAIPPVAPEAAPEVAVGAMPAEMPVIEPPTPDPSPLLPDVVPVMAVTSVAPVEAPPARRRRRLALGMWRIARPLLSLGLLVIGIALGVTTFGAVQPKDPTVLADSPSAVQPPAAVLEFITALAANNPDALRAAVPADPYRLLAGELQMRGYQEISSVDTLGTILDGDRSATEIVIHGSAGGGQGLVINLVVHAQNGVIVNFR